MQLPFAGKEIVEDSSLGLCLSPKWRRPKCLSLLIFKYVAGIRCRKTSVLPLFDKRPLRKVSIDLLVDWQCGFGCFSCLILFVEDSSLVFEREKYTENALVFNLRLLFSFLVVPLFVLVTRRSPVWLLDLLAVVLYRLGDCVDRLNSRSSTEHWIL